MCEQGTKVGQEPSSGQDCCCGHEQSAAKSNSFDFGQRFALDAAGDESTATDPFPLAGGSAAEICATIFTQAGAASLDVVLLGATDGDNFVAIDTQTLTGGVGYYAWAVTGLVWQELRIGVRAHSGSVPIVFALYVHTACA